MAHPYAFLAAGVIGAALAIYIWLKNESQRQTMGIASEDHIDKRYIPQSSCKDDVFPRNFNSGTNCIICIERQCSIKFLPCQHCCLCPECTKEYFKQSFKCPLCRAKIDEIMSL